MSNEFRAGVSFVDGMAQTAVIEFHPDGVKLHHLEETENADQGDLWFLDAVLNARNNVCGKISSVSVALDNDVVFLHSFPLDTSLAQPEQNEYVQWELSNFIDDFKPREHINDIHILRTRARDKIADVLAVCVKRSLLFSVQQALADRHIELQLADTYHFGAQYSLLTMYPELRTKVVALVGVTQNRTDVGIVVNGRLIDYRYGSMSTIEQHTDFLLPLVKDFSVSDLFLYGTAVLFELTENLRAALEINVTPLNPFRKMIIASSFRDFDKFSGEEHRFASCLGCALKRQ